jgi:hypothetical protein
MQASFVDVLTEILARPERDSLLAEPRRFRTVLIEHECSPKSMKREIAGLVTVLERRVPQRLLATPRTLVTGVMIANYAATVSSDTGLDEELALWAVETWVDGLGLPASRPDRQRGTGKKGKGQRRDRVGNVGTRTCPFCGASSVGSICAVCGRDTTAARRPCPNCNEMSPTSERTCWNCGTVFKSELAWKIPVIIALFALVFGLSLAIHLIR